MFLVLFLSLVEVHSQTAPYVSFMGMNLPNHAYVDLTTLGEDINDPGNTVKCHSDLTTCCSRDEGDPLAFWNAKSTNSMATCDSSPNYVNGSCVCGYSVN